jgi:hypothetical protein
MKKEVVIGYLNERFQSHSVGKDSWLSQKEVELVKENVDFKDLSDVIQEFVLESEKLGKVASEEISDLRRALESNEKLVSKMKSNELELQQARENAEKAQEQLNDKLAKTEAELRLKRFSREGAFAYTLVGLFLFIIIFSGTMNSLYQAATGEPIPEWLVNIFRDSLLLVGPLLGAAAGRIFQIKSIEQETTAGKSSVENYDRYDA